MKNILLVDDDRDVSRSLKSLFDSGKFHLTHVTTAEGAQVYLNERSDTDLVMLDVNLPEMSGLELLKKIKETSSDIPVIMISGQVSTENAIQAMREGAFEYLTKPFEIDRLLGVVNQACGYASASKSQSDVRPQENVSSLTLQSGSEEIIGKSPEIVEIAKLVGNLAKIDTPTLIFGETGTGKELVARAIHRNSSRRSGPFLTVNCASQADTLLESEIFGHEKGAFTGAYYKRVGKFEQAHSGTLFFDEVADLSLSTQAKLLRAIEESSYERVGGTEKIRTNVRVIAATSKSLVQAIKEGSFRVDLFYRLKVVSVFMPALKDRKGDLPILIDYFINRFAAQMNRSVPKMSAEAMDTLSKYSWPGNIRELENNIQSAMVMLKGDEILPEDLPACAEAENALELDLESLQESHVDLFNKIIEPILPKLAANNEGKIYNFLNSAMERALISSALKLYGSNQVKTSEALGISRNTLRDRIARYSLY
ncbi:MAG: sigma-54-dependent Fis family transcriptional regulator [candidate division Zixibacteria bacterium]|nr:sigma-54-dependent Fis family transcriptional regulator [candidate division Zixibacteria bacterium]